MHESPWPICTCEERWHMNSSGLSITSLLYGPCMCRLSFHAVQYVCMVCACAGSASMQSSTCAWSVHVQVQLTCSPVCTRVSHWTHNAKCRFSSAVTRVWPHGSNNSNCDHKIKCQYLFPEWIYTLGEPVALMGHYILWASL